MASRILLVEDDAELCALMGEFFAAVRPGSGAASYPAALKAARQKIKNTPGMDAPFYWAPFVFLGPPD